MREETRGRFEGVNVLILFQMMVIIKKYLEQKKVNKLFNSTIRRGKQSKSKKI